MLSLERLQPGLCADLAPAASERLGGGGGGRRLTWAASPPVPPESPQGIWSLSSPTSACLRSCARGCPQLRKGEPRV